MTQSQRVCEGCPIVEVCQQIAQPDVVRKLPSVQKDELCTLIMDAQLNRRGVISGCVALNNRNCLMSSSRQNQILELLMDQSEDTTPPEGL